MVSGEGFGTVPPLGWEVCSATLAFERKGSRGQGVHVMTDLEKPVQNLRYHKGQDVVAQIQVMPDVKRGRGQLRYRIVRQIRLHGFDRSRC